LTIAHRFNGGIRGGPLLSQVPEGRLRPSPKRRFSRPSGTGGRAGRAFPALKCWAIVRCPSGTRALSISCKSAGYTRSGSGWSIRNAQSSIPNPQSPIRNPQSSIPNPQCPILNPQSSIPNPQSAIRNPQSPIPNPQPGIPNPQSAIPNPQSPIRNLTVVSSSAGSIRPGTAWPPARRTRRRGPRLRATHTRRSPDRRTGQNIRIPRR